MLDQDHEVNTTTDDPSPLGHMFWKGDRIERAAAATGMKGWPVPGMIPPGLTLLAGQPKLGKTNLSLELAWSIASGNDALGSVLTHQGDVLYLAAETGASEMQFRWSEAWPDEPWPDRLTVVPMDTLNSYTGPLFPVFEEWRKQSDHPSLVILDTFTALITLRQADGPGGFRADYQALRPFTNWAEENNLSLVVVHHTNQRTLEKGEDWMNGIAGTNGLVGAADTVMLLRRHSDDETGNDNALQLMAKGRYLPEQDLTLIPAGRRFLMFNEVKATERMGDRMRVVLDAVVSAGGTATLEQVLTATALPPNTVRSYLHRLVKRDVLKRTDRGVYTLVIEGA